MLKALETIEGLRDGLYVPDSVLADVCRDPDLLPVHAGALLSLLGDEPQKLPFRTLLLGNHPSLTWLSEETSEATRPEVYRVCYKISCQLRSGELVGEGLWREFAELLPESGRESDASAFVLMEVVRHPLRFEDTLALAKAYLESGSIYDYRPAVSPRRLVRRYPSGAVSEKVALILPTVLSGLGSDLPVASNFLVAKSLGFTGGTWDKLSSIPGFRFPKPGTEAEGVLKRINVVMCVTSDDVAPADRKTYQIRSLAGSVESDALIAASIASKQAAFPYHSLLLDMRFGQGAFLRSKSSTKTVAGLIEGILNRWGLTCTSVYHDTSLPTGAAIGNAVEVAESIAVMGKTGTGPWLPQLLDLQWELVIEFLHVLMVLEFGTQIASIAVDKARTMRQDGSLLRWHARFLQAHGVSNETAERISGDAYAFFFAKAHVASIRSDRRGTLKSIDQKMLGKTVNFELGAGGNAYGGDRDLLGGCILRVSPGSDIEVGETLCLVVSDQGSLDPQVIDRIRGSFEFSVP